MDNLREALEECVQTTQWLNKQQRIASRDLSLLYRRRRGSDSRLFELFRPKQSDASINRLATQLRVLLERFVSSDTDRIGNGLFSLMGGLSTMREPTVPQFAQTLLKPTIVLGPDRVIDLLSGWATGEPLRFQECALLEGVTIEQEIKLKEGVTLTKLPLSSADLPASLPFPHMGRSSSDYRGGVVMCIDCEQWPAIYAPLDKKTWDLSDEPPRTITCASGEMPNLSYDSFCESLSLACNHYVHWQSTWRDHGELQLFSNMRSGGGSYRAPSWPAKRVVSQEDLELARNIHLKRHSGARRRNVDRAIRRWMSSKQRPSYADKLIDLRIALESLGTSINWSIPGDVTALGA